MRETRRLRLDRIASSTRNARLTPEVFVGAEVIAEEGYVLAVKILDYKSTYNMVEDPSGRMIPLRAGDVLSPKIDFPEPLLAEVDDFAAAILEGKRPISDARTGLAVVRALEAAQRSLDMAGSPVSL